MLKQRIIRLVAGLALLAALTGVSGVVANELGLELTAPVHACETPHGSGGC